MPELPEVETIRKQLEMAVVGATIVGVEVRRAACYEGSTAVEGERIVGFERVGKYLYVIFESGRGLVIHLKMTGRLVLNAAAYETFPHTRVVIKLADNRRLYYWDSRTFGYVKYVEKVQQERQKQQSRMGPEPWEIDKKSFFELCQKSGRAIKNLILDQKLISGVGNIYANDALWEAGINPSRAAMSLTPKETAKLLSALRYVLERGIATGGASDNSYVDGLGNKGSYQKEFRVYRRSREPCWRCGFPIERVVIGGRGSFWCQRCQR